MSSSSFSNIECKFVCDTSADAFMTLEVFSKDPDLIQRVMNNICFDGCDDLAMEGYPPEHTKGFARRKIFISVKHKK